MDLAQVLHQMPVHKPGHLSGCQIRSTRTMAQRRRTVLGLLYWGTCDMFFSGVLVQIQCGTNTQAWTYLVKLIYINDYKTIGTTLLSMREISF